MTPFPSACLFVTSEFILMCLHRRIWGMPFLSRFSDRALARSSANTPEAKRLAHPPSLAGGLAIGLRLLSLVGDDAALDEWLKQLIAVRTEHGFPHWRAQGEIYRGWAEVKRNNVTEGIARLRTSSAAYRASGGELFVPHYFDLLATACEIAGEIEEGLALLDDALGIGQKNRRALVGSRTGQAQRPAATAEGACGGR